MDVTVGLSNVTGDVTDSVSPDFIYPRTWIPVRIVNILFGVAIIEGTLITLSNLLTIVTYARNPSLHRCNTDLYVLYLAVADTVTGPQLLLLTVRKRYFPYASPRTAAFLLEGLFRVSLTTSVMTLTLIAVDRLVAVWRPSILLHPHDPSPCARAGRCDVDLRHDVDRRAVRIRNTYG